MKFLVFILLSVLTAEGNGVLLHRIDMQVPASSRANGIWKIEFHVDEASLKASGEWEPEYGNAPAVTRNQAVKLALEAAKIEPGTTEGKVLVSLKKVNEWEVGKKTVPAGCSPWFYVVELRHGTPAPEGRFFLVTVGGKVANSSLVD